jgi:hypothetical protein
MIKMLQQRINRRSQGWVEMNGMCVSGRAFHCQPALRILLSAVLLFGSTSLFSTHLYATSVVALIDHANQKLVIAADCQVSRGLQPISACKIIQEPGCTAAMAGLYDEMTAPFHLREVVRAACREPGDLRAKAEAFVRMARKPYEEAVRGIRRVQPGDFAKTIANKPTEVIFAGIQEGEVGLIVRGLVADSAGKITVERLESTAPSYARIGYFAGLNGHIRSYIKSHPDWAKEEYAKLAPRFVELEIAAHPDLAGLPVSALQIDNKGDVVWLAKGACNARQSD